MTPVSIIKFTSHRLSIAVVVVLVALVFVPIPRSIIPYAPLSEQEELILAQNKMSDFAWYAEFFKVLAEEKGAVHAYRTLKEAPFSPGIDLHLLGHVVGDALYKQKGVEGIALCTDEFRNACSHSIVVGAFLEEGEEALLHLSKLCERAPGGTGAYTMCFHGLGHGVLAYTSYDLEQTVALCAKVGTHEHMMREYDECVGGALMELISGGGHDRELWTRMRTSLFQPNDPLYPCTADYMKDVRPMCFSYLTPYLVEVAGGSMGSPTSEEIIRAFVYCQALPEASEERKSCSGGFGKEFVTLVAGRDIRDIEYMSEESLKKVHEWCLYAGEGADVLACDHSAMQSLFWGGENDPQGAVTYCSVLEGDTSKEACFAGLSREVLQYVENREGRAGICARYPEKYEEQCRELLLL